MSTNHLSVARLIVCERAPYFSSMVLRLCGCPIVQPGLGTLAVTDDGRLVVDHAKVAAWYAEEHGPLKVASVLVHECLHLLFDHPRRAVAAGCEAPEQRKLWGWAADCSINDQLRLAKDADDQPLWCLPGNPLFPETFDLPLGKSTEEYYAALRAKLPPRAARHQCAVCSGACGSGSGGNPTSGEPAPDGTEPGQVGGAGDPDNDSGGNGQGTSAPVPAPLTQDELDVLRASVASEIAAARSRGELPAGFGLELDALVAPPQVDWREVLRHRVGAVAERRAGAELPTYARPNRRQAGLGWDSGAPRLASRMATRLRVVLLQDTSGSMQDDLVVCAGEVAGIIEHAGGVLLAIYCDAIVHNAVEVASAVEFVEHLVGGGGTSMIPGIAAAVRAHEEEEVGLLIVLTDMEIGDPGSEPPFPVIWLTTTDAPTPSWGEVIRVQVAG